MKSTVSVTRCPISREKGRSTTISTSGRLRNATALMTMAVAAVFQASTEPLDFPSLAAKSRSAARSA